MKTHERTLKMMENFMDMHNDGMSIQEIAEQYKLSTVTVYNKLSEIARKNGTTREALLQVVHAPHTGGAWGYKSIPKVDTSEVDTKFLEVTKELTGLIGAVKNVVKDMELEEM